MKKTLFYFIYMFIVLTTLMVFFSFQSIEPSGAGLGGMGYGLLKIASIFLLVIFTSIFYFLSQNIKVFLKYLFFPLVILLLSILFSSYSAKFHQMKEIQNYEEEKIKKENKKKSDLILLINNANNQKYLTQFFKEREEEKNHLYNRKDLLKMYFLLGFYNLDNEPIIADKIREFFLENNTTYIYMPASTLKIVTVGNVNDAFAEAYHYMIELGRDDLIQNSCQIYRKYQIKFSTISCPINITPIELFEYKVMNKRFLKNNFDKYPIPN